MIRLGWAGVFLVLAGFAMWHDILVWILFVGIAINLLQMEFRLGHKPVVTQPPPVPGNVPLGVLGEFFHEAEPVYGLYIQLDGKPVLVDVKEDTRLAERMAYALQLAAHSVDLDKSLARFIAAHPAFKTRDVASIGLHSKDDVLSGEVFWNPDGYTRLVGMEFVEH